MPQKIVTFEEIKKEGKFKTVLGDGVSLSICTLVKVAFGSAKKPDGNICMISSSQKVVAV